MRLINTSTTAPTKATMIDPIIPLPFQKRAMEIEQIPNWSQMEIPRFTGQMRIIRKTGMVQIDVEEYEDNSTAGRGNMRVILICE